MTGSARRSQPLAAAVKAFPAPAGIVRPRLAELRAAAKEAGVDDALNALLAEHKTLGRFLAATMEASPFLRSLCLDDPARLVAVLGADPQKRLAALYGEVAASWRGTDEAGLAIALRRFRAEAALLIALADLGLVCDAVAVTAALTDFASAAVSAAAAFLLRAEHDAGRLALPDPEQPETGSGWILLGMGKFGAGELNYSSDIDLIVLYDRDVAPLADDIEPTPFFVRLTQRLVKLLQERTVDGYVFRTDLRLRPDPGSTAVAISTAAALQYYESRGQNWERAALIKARPVAGDRAAGDAFLAELGPYVWRKYLDFAAISDIHSIKRQIHDHRGHATVAVAGHNIKLGRGGIREIEFFVQTQQLIAGGRNLALRGRRTLEMLAALDDAGWIDSEARDDLSAAYLRLRAIEHRLQMIADEQTHTLPAEPDELAVVARLSGFKSAEAFEAALLPDLELVRDHYARLFETAPALSTETGSLVFTGDDDDPDTVETLAQLGFSSPSGVIRTVRAWHYGRYAAMRSSAARETLTELTPSLLAALAGTDNADAAFAAFDRFLGRLPAGVQLFALLGSNPGLLSLLATIMGAAPRLADTISRRPHVLDAVLEPAFFGRLPPPELLRDRLQATLDQAQSYEDALDRARIFAQEQNFLIGVRVLAGAIDARQAGMAYADLADLLVASLFERVRDQFESAHGRMPGGRIAVLAMGKLGGREMTASSDLDLIVLYDFEEAATGSDGERPLTGGQYYARLTQRLVAALSAPTAEGTLYEVDLRLRPSGRSGPLATHIDAFRHYQANDAWTWEHMALTRARPVAGDAALIRRIAREMAEVLAAPRDATKVRADVVDMRVLLQAEKGGGLWDLKQAPGGMVDLEFIAQTLQLIHGAEHKDILSPETEAVLAAAEKAGVLPPADSDILLPALRLYQGLTQLMRLALDRPFDPADAPGGLLLLLAQAGELPDFRTLEAHVGQTEADVRAAFERIVGKVSTKARKRAR